jgi:YD repeat-containing protein
MESIMAGSMVKRPYSAKKKRSQQDGAGVAGAVMWLLTAVLLAIGAFELPNLLDVWRSRANEATTRAADPSDQGTLVLRTDGDQCERVKYDGAGRVVERSRPCANADLELDEHGRPLPTGTMHRLDAIGKSFLGRQ